MEDKLGQYRGKRDFSVTNEPVGRTRKSADDLRFCIQFHAARNDHYDLRLEYGGVALSWAVPKGPSYDPKEKRLAMRVEDHPVDYMSFEGTIPKGEYGGGTVMLWDEGVWIPGSDPQAGLKEGSLKFTLEGERMRGDWALVRMKSETDAWLLIKERDAYAKSTSGISRFSRSVRTKRTMREIAAAAKQNPFSQAHVMLCELCEGLPSDMGWLFELKYDGHRTLAFCENGTCVLRTRNGLDCTAKFSAAAEGIQTLLKDRAAVLDGEMIVARKDGLSDFGALQAYAAGRRREGLSYVLFDLLALDGEDLRFRPLAERKQKLEKLLEDAPPVLSYSSHAEKMTKREAARLKARGFEGIVMKRADSAYTAGKDGNWRKWKFRNAEEFVVGGYLKGEAGFRSLLLGVSEGGALAFAGCVGTGFSEETRKALTRALAAREQAACPFADLPQRYKKSAVFVSPGIVVQVEYAEITRSGVLRQASFKGIRGDKSAAEVRRETPRGKAKRGPKDGEKKKAEEKPKVGRTRGGETTVMGIRITHSEKQMFSDPVLTKGELAAYYAAVAPRMFPYLRGRRLSLVCCPAGIGGETFFRRHLDGAFEGVEIGIPQEGEAGNFCVKAEKGIVSLAQYNAVEFHVRGGIRGKDDVMVFDLDPDEGLPLAETRRGARELRAALSDLGLSCFLKTSGGKGYHIVVPFRNGTDGEAFRAFARRVALLMEERFPERFTANMKKEARAGKIYLDWQRNGLSSTSVAPYSVRARAGAPVSMPIRWEELSRVAPGGVTVKDVLRRLEKGDAWEDYFAVKRSQSLK